MAEEIAVHIAFYGDSLTTGIPGVPFLRELRAMRAGDALTNLGRGGDTVISLYRRIAKGNAPAPLDVAVLWIGVNDVLASVSWSHSALKRALHQPPARDHGEFEDYYRRTIELLQRSARSVIAVPPLLIGEDLANPWNKQLDALRKVAASVAASFDNVRYVDLHGLLACRLWGREVSKYIPKSVTVIALEALLLHSPDRVDHAAARRGLHFTLDGIHLNSAGAKVVAGQLHRSLRSLP